MAVGGGGAQRQEQETGSSHLEPQAEAERIDYSRVEALNTQSPLPGMDFPQQNPTT